MLRQTKLQHARVLQVPKDDDLDLFEHLLQQFEDLRDEQ
jgi:hypothetical protein